MVGDRQFWARFGRRGWPLVAAAVLLVGCGRSLAKADAHEALGDSMMTQAAYPAAVGEYVQSAMLDSNEPRRWLKLARAQRESGNGGQAAASFQRALDLDPANIEALQNLSVLMVRAGRYDDVHTVLDPLLVLAPDDLAGALASGAIALHERRYDDAGAIADKLMAGTPNSPEGFLLKAHVLQAQGHAKAGADLLARFMGQHGDDARLAEELLGLYQAARSREGIRSVSLLLARLEPNDPRYAMEAVRALHAQGDEAAADAQLDAVKSRFGNNTEVMGAVADYLTATLPRERRAAAVARLADGRPTGVAAMLAERLIRLGAPDAALDLLRTRADGPVDNATADVKARYAEALMAAGKNDAAVAQANAVLAFDNSNDVALTVRAKAALARGQWAAALTDAQAVAADRPDDGAAALLVARIYDASGNRVLAAKAYGDAAAAAPDDLGVMAERVAWMQAHGQAPDAKGLAAQFAGTHPQLAGAWDLYARACDKAGDPRCAAVARGRRPGG